MMGVPISNDTNSSSPVSRRSGSKNVFAFLDSNELGVTSGREKNEMRNGSLLMHSTAIIPSPILLWRFKVILFLIWGISCCKICWSSVMRMSANVRDLFLYEAFLYYNPLLLVALMVWLWGVNLWVFALSSVNYSKIFNLDHTHRTHWEIWKVLPLEYIILVVCYMDDHHGINQHDSLPSPLLTWRGVLGCITTSVILYAAILMVLISPFDIFYLSSRYYFLSTLWRIVLPLQAITFSDFFLADILTSMSKVLSDLERSICRMVNRQVATIAWFEADSICGSHSILIPIVLVSPYLCRFFQCLRQYKDTKEKIYLFNALKYSTAVPVIFLSALKYHVFPEKWSNFYRPLWLLSSVINSSYSFYWDVSRDWNLSVFTRIFKFKTSNFFSNILYGRQWVYYWVLGSNLILRCTWTYKLSAHLRHNYLTVFAITALEIVRRFQWIFFRLENEWNNMTLKQGSQLPMAEILKAEDQLLGSANHDM